MQWVDPLFAGVVAFFLTLGIRAASSNRLIRSKLRLSLLLFAAHVLLAGVLDWSSRQSGQSAADLAARIRSIDHLVLALAIVNIVVVLLINPFRSDRVPDHFPNIVQDTIVIALFALVATFVMREKLLTTSAVTAVVIGFALQDTLGNMFAGLAIQIEKPFRVGHWVTVGGLEGMVTEITWRATKLRTKTGNLVVMPNNILSKEAVVNYSEPALPTRLEVELGVSYDVPPNDVKAALLEAVKGLEAVLETPAPDVVVADFGNSAIIYRVRFWTTDFGRDGLVRDRVRTAIYYVLRRRRMEIPFPIQVQYQRREEPSRTLERARELEALLARVDLFSPLSDENRAELVSCSVEQIYGAGEAIVRQGSAGESLFVVCRGCVRVTVDPGGREVATIGEGGYFGEMSLLTGEPRTATVSAVGDCSVLEITASSFRRIALANPAVLDQITRDVSLRREGLARTREAAFAAAVPPDVAHASFLARVQRFLGLRVES
ncbi:MAG: cyclic nucleotide-binding domain-containing protein [Vicinamibacterales bacterium]